MTDSANRMVLNSDPAEVAQLQARLLLGFSDTGFDEMAAFQLTCAVVEAINNCIEHAYRGENGHPITLEWERDEGGVRIEIRDRGAPMPALPADAGTTPEVDAESGRGWYIIRQWTDSVRYARQGGQNVLTLTRRL